MQSESVFFYQANSILISLSCLSILLSVGEIHTRLLDAVSKLPSGPLSLRGKGEGMVYSFPKKKTPLIFFFFSSPWQPIQLGGFHFLNSPQIVGELTGLLKASCFTPISS